jgi:ComF family protein
MQPVFSSDASRAGVAGLFSLLTGHRCLACARPAARMVCLACVRSLPGAGRPRCSVCAIGLASAAQSNTVCGACQRTPPPFDASIAALDYGAPVDTLVRALKFGEQFGVATLLAQQLAARLPADWQCDVLLPVPLSAQRLAVRGYNQSWLVLRALPRHLGPQDWRVLKRVRDTAAQMELPFDARRSNIRNAFAVAGEVRGKHVAVVDDVMTTGHTLQEVARTLKKAGAAKITNLVVARTP